MALAVTAFLGCSNLFGGGGNGSDGSGDSKSEHEKMLEDLNVDTDLGKRKSPEGRTLSESENPTGSEYSTFSALTEVFLGDTGDFNATGRARLYEESLQTASSSGTTTESNLNDSAGVGGLFDDDALEEIVYVGRYDDGDGKHALYARVVDDLSSDPSGSLGNKRPIAQGLADNNELSAAAGDFDGDDRAEVAVAYDRIVYVLDDMESRLEVMAEYTVSDSTLGELVDVAALSMTEGNRDDLFLLTAPDSADGAKDKSAHYYDVVNTDGFSSADSGQLRVESDGFGTVDIHWLHGMRVGEIDPVSESGAEFTDAGAAEGAPADEIIITGQYVGSNNYVLFATAFRPDGSGGIEQVGYRQAATESRGGFESGRLSGLPFVPVDVNGDRTDELFNPRTGDFELRLTGNVVESSAYNGPTPDTTSLDNPIAVGNFTGGTQGDQRLQQDVLFVDDDDDAWVYGVNVNPTNGDSEAVESWQPGTSVADFSNGGSHIYVIANMDEDSDVLQFVRHELAFTNPKVLAVMSAPPYYTNTAQAEGNLDTSFGKGQGTTESTTQSIGFSAGVTFGATAEAPVFGSTLGEFKSTVTTTTTLNQSFGTSTTVSKRVAWSAGSQDKVLFTAIPYDVYYYEIVKSSDPDAEGTMSRISVPRDPATQAVPLDLYNSSNGDNPDVTIFDHTVGDPTTYPGSINEIDPGEPSGYRIGPKLVGLSDVSADNYGALTLEISETKGETLSQSVNVSVSFEAEAVIGGVVGGTQFGFSYGHSSSTTVTNSTTFTGVIADIPEKDGSPVKEQYQTGLYVFESSNSVGDSTNTFPVISYWVE